MHVNKLTPLSEQKGKESVQKEYILKSRNPMDQVSDMKPDQNTNNAVTPKFPIMEISDINFVHVN